MISRDKDVSSKLTFLHTNKDEKHNTRRRLTTLHFNSTSFNLRIKHIFPQIRFRELLKLKRRRVGEDEEEAYQ